MRIRARKGSWERFLKSKHEILDSQDTVSKLPETVIQHMMSYLPSPDKDQVRFLSKKWRRLSAQNQIELWLNKCRLNELEFPKILNDDFHSLEFLSLNQCPGMRNLKLVNFKLETFYLVYCGTLKNVHLNMPNLETFFFHGPRVRPCVFEFINCKRLRILHLVGVAMNTMMFINCNESFPVLQRLTLAGCDMTGSITISSNSLKKLSFIRFNNPVGFFIDTPNLCSFSYDGSVIAPLQNINFPHLKAAYVDLHPNRYKKRDEIWFTRLTEMLHCFKHAKRVDFSTNSEKNIIIPKHLRRTLVPPLDKISYIGVRTTARSFNVVNVTDSMLWISPWVDYVICLSQSWEFLLQLSHVESWRRRDGSCRFCTSHSSKCWRHLVTGYAVDHTFSDPKKEVMLYLEANLRSVGRSGVDLGELRFI